MFKKPEPTASQFTDDQIKHLEFIQDVITRMNSNSFQMKGWMVAIVSALLALRANTNNEYFTLIAILPTLIFWGLDAYYLQLERKFRGLYDEVAKVKSPPEGAEELKPFAMPINRYKGNTYSYWDVLKSDTILYLYMPTILLLIVITAIF